MSKVVFHGWREIDGTLVSTVTGILSLRFEIPAPGKRAIAIPVWSECSAVEAERWNEFLVDLYVPGDDFSPLTMDDGDEYLRGLETAFANATLVAAEFVP